MNAHAAVVFDEAQLAELIEEATDAGAAGAHHLSQGLLAELRDDDRLRSMRFAKIGEQQEDAGQAFLGGIEKLIDQIRFHLAAMGQ